MCTPLNLPIIMHTQHALCNFNPSKKLPRQIMDSYRFTEPLGLVLEELDGLKIANLRQCLVSPYVQLLYTVQCPLRQYGLWSFQTGDTKLDRFLPKNHNQRKLLNFEVPKFDFQSQFSMSKIIRIFLNFFLLKNTNLGAHILLLTFFDKIIF